TNYMDGNQVFNQLGDQSNRCSQYNTRQNIFLIYVRHTYPFLFHGFQEKHPDSFELDVLLTYKLESSTLFNSSSIVCTTSVSEPSLNGDTKLAASTISRKV